VDSQIDEFPKELYAVVSQLSADSALVLNLRLDSGSIVFERLIPLSVTGTDWLVQSYNNGRDAGPHHSWRRSRPLLSAKTALSLVVQAAMRTTERYTVEGESVAIRLMTTTRLACAPP
jgi:hypothetical protein